MRSAYELHAENDDFSQPGARARDVMDDAQRVRFVEQVSGGVPRGVRGELIERPLEYWKRIDPYVGKRIEEEVREGADPEPVAGMGES